MYGYKRKNHLWDSPRAKVTTTTTTTTTTPTPRGIMPLASTVVPTTSPIARESSTVGVGLPNTTMPTPSLPSMVSFPTDAVGSQVMGGNHPMASSITGAVTPHPPQNSIQSCFDTLQRYMALLSVHAEEKASIIAMIESIAQYAQERLRIKEILEEGETCLQQFTQLRSSIDVALAGISSTTPSCLTDSFVSSSQLTNTIGSGFSSASVQRGRAKVDTDLAECRRLLQQLEMFARSFQDLQRRRAHACEVLRGGMREEENEEPQPQPKTQTWRSSGLNTQCVGDPVLRLHGTLEDCMTQLRQHWDEAVSFAVTNLLQKLCGHSQDAIDGVPVGEQDDSFSSDRIYTALLQLSDETMGRVETMRTRITRLGSSRIEEAEALEKLLASMDNYDPTAEQRANRRKQIDAELEDLRSWLGQIAQIRQRVVDVTEKLQQQQQQFMLAGKLESAASSRRPSPCPFSHNGIDSAVSSCRPSSAVPGSLEEWHQALISTETLGVRERMGGSGQTQLSFFPQDPSSTSMPTTNTTTTTNTNTNTTTAGTEGTEPGTVSAADNNDNEDGAANRKTASSSRVERRLVPSSTIVADSTTDGNENNGKNCIQSGNMGYPASKGIEGGDPSTFRTASGKNDHKDAGEEAILPTRHPRNTINMDYDTNNNLDNEGEVDDDNSDDSTSCYHASAFDAGYRRQKLRRKRSGGYFGSILSFARAVVERATRFSDSEDEDDYDYDDDDEMRGNKRRRQRLE
ncbi:hypothetical protein LSM04_007260 [Trypanosoma melophagium]|uniref:uncharacterized protein n=1 Tax=Trypanosoma melophagium TaxID=715481 RepID=UPI00351A736A|nr:hypothetical protein LSM04_007260 [Trypanosoma melophagium]